jgi:hypothetical protein
MVNWKGCGRKQLESNVKYHPSISREGSRNIYRDTVAESQTLPMDCYLEVVGGLVSLQCEEGRPKAVRDKVAGKGQQQYY